MARDDPVLGPALRHQLRHGHRHRHYHGVPVRHQLGVLLALRRRRFRRAAGDRGDDGLLPRGDLRRPVLFRLGPAQPGGASGGDLAGRPRREPVRPVDPGGQRVDAEPGGRPLQPRHHADGDHLVLRRVLQSRRPGEVRAHGERGLRHRRGLRAGGERLLSAARPEPGVRQALDDRGRELRPRFGAFGGGPRRRERLHREPPSEDEDRRHRGGVGDPSGAGRLQPVRGARHRRRPQQLRDQGPVGARPDRHALGRPGGDRDQRFGRAGQGTAAQGRRRLPGAQARARRPGRRRGAARLRRQLARHRLRPPAQT